LQGRAENKVGKCAQRALDVRAELWARDRRALDTRSARVLGARRLPHLRERVCCAIFDLIQCALHVGHEFCLCSSRLLLDFCERCARYVCGSIVCHSGSFPGSGFDRSQEIAASAAAK